MSRVLTTVVRLLALALLLAALTGCPKGSGGINLGTCLTKCRNDLDERVRGLLAKGQVPGLAEEKFEEECKAACRDKHPQ